MMPFNYASLLPKPIVYDGMESVVLVGTRSLLKRSISLPF